MNYLDNPKLMKLTNEIHFFNEQGIKVSIEVGKRLEEGKSEFNTSEDWMNWIESEFGYKKSQAYKLVAISKRFHSSGISLEGKSINEVYALAAFDDDDLRESKQMPNGGHKKLIDMSQKEIEQYKQTITKLTEKLEEEMNKPPVTEIVEIVPKNLQKKIEDLEFKNFHLKSGYEKAKEKLKQMELQEPSDFNEEEAKKQREKLQHEADITTMNMRIAYKNFIEQGAVSTYIQGAIAHASEAEKRHLHEMVGMAEKVIHDTKLALNGRKLGAVNE